MSCFQSPLHPHILFLRNLSPHFPTYSFHCHFCWKSFDGSTSIYCCEKCVFYIHTSCATSPPPHQIQHPRHQHPLELGVVPDDKWKNGIYYRCVEFDRGCNFMLHIPDAIKTLQVEKYYCSVLREASDGESRLQFAHDHPLSSFPARRTTSCGGCGVDIEEEEEVYGCSECNIFLHEACAKAPLEIQHHPFHPKHPLFLFYDSSGKAQCRACYSESPMFDSTNSRNTAPPIRYRCEECELILDLSCVISTMPCEDDDDDVREDLKRRPSAIDHPLHPHLLSSYHSKTHTKIKCRNCDWTIPSGDFYGCSDCFFFLHKSCARPPADAIQHYLHPEHALTFAKYADAKEHNCPSCTFQVRRDSYCYTCEMCDIFIHPICATATLSDLEEAGGMTVKHPLHEHELKLYYTFCAGGSCTVCAGSIERTLAYRCFSKGCGFKIHKSCLQLSSKLEHPSHSLHPLTFYFPNEDEVIVCRGCRERFVLDFTFSCGECNFYLHVKCAQKPTLKHPFHEHLLFYFEQETYASMLADRKCSACGKSCKLDFFSCGQCDFSLHYDCSQLPLTIKSEHHWDPLVLRESYKEEYHRRHYCDICEKRRDPNKWVYFCETYNCELVAHVECALSPGKREVIEEDDFIIRAEHIQTREKEIRKAQEKVDAKKASLRPQMEELESMRAELELQRLQLKELKTEHAKWINMGVIEEDESIGGEGDIDSTYGKSEKLKAILEDLETEQANWLIDFLKTECHLPTTFFSRTTGTSSSTGTAQSVDDYLI